MSDVSGPINVASGSAVSVESILQDIASRLGRGSLLRLGSRSLAPTEPDVIEGDNRILRTSVGFHPRFDIESGVADTIAAREG